ncbi:winged helix-turn-helix domain-containing protein [Halorussus halophilus]|uniref:winged helix-turn-helix domain-containing protein n=1 Tax=Halorussus halophilus TaxID=2650975 RepID=UPI001301526E|nr:helix-turn-helix domain-containing protein [Halorussus halophilus]
MSQSTIAGIRPDFHSHPGTTQTVVESEERVATLLETLDDSDCRTVLKATSDESLSAREISEVCGIPLSTTYRKLDLLTEAGLLEERTRLRRSGKHTSEYARQVDDITVSVDADSGFELTVTQRETQTQVGGSSVAGGQ